MSGTKQNAPLLMTTSMEFVSMLSSAAVLLSEPESDPPKVEDSLPDVLVRFSTSPTTKVQYSSMPRAIARLRVCSTWGGRGLGSYRNEGRIVLVQPRKRFSNPTITRSTKAPIPLMVRCPRPRQNQLRQCTTLQGTNPRLDRFLREVVLKKLFTSQIQR